MSHNCHRYLQRSRYIGNVYIVPKAIYYDSLLERYLLLKYSVLICLNVTYACSMNAHMRNEREEI